MGRCYTEGVVVWCGGRLEGGRRGRRGRRGISSGEERGQQRRGRRIREQGMLQAHGGRLGGRVTGRRCIEGSRLSTATDGGAVSAVQRRSCCRRRAVVMGLGDGMAQWGPPVIGGDRKRGMAVAMVAACVLGEGARAGRWRGGEGRAGQRAGGGNSKREREQQRK